jgi:hypothetical protein
LVNLIKLSLPGFLISNRSGTMGVWCGYNQF